jgi:hypothetical protein
MQTKAMMEPSGSPVPRVIPKPTHVHGADNAAAATSQTKER